MQDWVAAGFAPDAFWHQTPQLIAIAFAGKTAQAERAHDERASLAWHIAVLSRLPKIPELKTLLAPAAAAAAPAQTSDDHFAIFSAIAATQSHRLN